MQYLDWLRGVAVIAMVLAHVSDSWTHPSQRMSEEWYVVAFIGGVASPLFLFLAGVAIAISAGVKGPAVARRRGWQVFGLALLFRVQSQVLGWGPLDNLLKVDMLNVMGLSMVAASYVWQVSSDGRARVALLAVITTAIAMITPIVRDVTWLAALPDPLEAYVRPDGRYAAFPFFPWGGFLFGGAIAGELVQGVRLGRIRDVVLQNALALTGGAGVVLAYLASYQPSIYQSSSFWHDSPTFFFIRLGLVTILIPMASVTEQLLPTRIFAPIVTMGRSSLFVYWIHVELVYGVLAEPIKRALPLWASVVLAATLCIALYGVVLVKNRLLSRGERRERKPLVPASQL